MIQFFGSNPTGGVIAMRKKYTIISGQRGSSLIAVSLFVVAMGLMSAAGLQTYRQYDTARRTVETQDGLEAMRRAVVAYYAQNGRFPCPAPLVVGPADARFGREAATPCTASTGSGGGGGGGWGWNDGRWGWHGGGGHGPLNVGAWLGWGGTSSGGNTVEIDASGTAQATGTGNRRIRIGAVPTRLLNLPDTAGIDAYGHRIVYAVVEQMASPGAAAVNNPGAISIEDRSGNNASRNRAVAVLFSHGGDEAGAWDINGIPLQPCNDSALGGENCDYDANFVNTINKSDRGGSGYFTHRVVYIGPDVIGKN